MAAGDRSTHQSRGEEHTYAPAAPRTLAPHHLRLIEASAITTEVRDARGYYSETTKSYLRRLGFAESQLLAPCLVIPLWNVWGEQVLYEIRPDEPRVLNGDKSKYERPAKSRLILDVHPEARSKLGDPCEPVWITEGTRKGDSLVSAGACAIALPGVWGFRGKNEIDGYTALGDWEAVTLKGRTVYIVFDSDVVTKQQVRLALTRLRAFLISRGVAPEDIRIVRLPSGNGGAKVGVDDYRGEGHGIDDLVQLASPDLPPLVGGEHDGKTVVSFLKDAPVSEAVIVPDGYRLGPDGIEKFKLAQNGVAYPVRLSVAPILMSGRLEDVGDHSEHVRLAFPRHGAWRQHIIPRQDAFDKSGLIKAASVGVPVHSNNASDLVGYLAEYEAVNGAHIPRERVSRSMGWLPDGSFLWGRTLIGGAGVALAPQPGLEHVADAFKADGEFDLWRDKAREIGYHPVAAAILVASFTAALQWILGLANFTVDVASATTRGKTTALRLAASVWGQPDERTRPSVVQLWNATPVFIERVAGLCDHFPVFLDESKLAKSTQDIARTIYMLGNGEGRGRGTVSGIAPTVRFHTIGISTGESKIVTSTQDGGARARVISFEGCPFGDTSSKAAAIADEINEVVTGNYGLAGPRWISYLQAHRDDWSKYRDTYRQVRTEYRNEFGGDPVLGRLTGYLAGLDVALALLDEALDLTWPVEDITKAIIQAVRQSGAEADRYEAAREHVIAWAAGHQHDFDGQLATIGQNEDARIPVDGYAGRWYDGEPIYFRPDRLDKILTDGNWDPEAVRRVWHERGWTIPGNDGRPTKVVKVGGQSLRAVCLRVGGADA